jgi:hypothetical protein
MNDNRPVSQPIAPEAKGKARQFLAAIRTADDETMALLDATLSTLKRRGKSHRATPMMRIQLERLWQKFPAFGSAYRSFEHSRGEICAVEVRWSTGGLRLPHADWDPRTQEEGLYLTSIVMSLQSKKGDTGIGENNCFIGLHALARYFERNRCRDNASLEADLRPIADLHRRLLRTSYDAGKDPPPLGAVVIATPHGEWRGNLVVAEGWPWVLRVQTYISADTIADKAAETAAA